MKIYFIFIFFVASAKVLLGFDVIDIGGKEFNIITPSQFYKNSKSGLVYKHFSSVYSESKFLVHAVFSSCLEDFDGNRDDVRYVVLFEHEHNRFTDRTSKFFVSSTNDIKKEVRSNNITEKAALINNNSKTIKDLTGENITIEKVQFLDNIIDTNNCFLISCIIKTKFSNEVATEVLFNGLLFAKNRIFFVRRHSNLKAYDIDRKESSDYLQRLLVLNQ